MIGSQAVALIFSKVYFVDWILLLWLTGLCII